jgi:hypothetical protein
MASVIILMTLIVSINENEKYYQEKYGEKSIKKVLNQGAIFIFEAISQNITTMENVIDPDVASKIQKKIFNILHNQLLVLTEMPIINKKLKMKKTDIIKFKFEDENIYEDKYKKLSRIENDEIEQYITTKYGTIGQCSFIIGWLMAMSDSNQKTIDLISNLGTSFGIMVKLTHDFNSLEDNIKNAKDMSFNYIVNCGIHNSFSLLDKNKIDFIQGCMTNGIFNGIIKEIIEKLNQNYESCLENTSLELQSQYSSTVGTKSKN